MATDYDAPRKVDDDLAEDSIEELKASRRGDTKSGIVDVVGRVGVGAGMRGRTTAMGSSATVVSDSIDLLDVSSAQRAIWFDEQLSP